MSILIGCDSFLALRNVRNGDFNKHLSGHRIICLVDPDQYSGSELVAPPGVEVEALLQFDPKQDPGTQSLMTSAYMARKCCYDPVTMWQKLRASSVNNNLDKPFRQKMSLAKAGFELVTNWFRGRMGDAQKQRKAFANLLQNHPVADSYKALFDKFEPELVAAFSLEGHREMALMEAANKANIPTLVMIRSRDNLAAKIQHIPDAHAYLVWSDTMRDFFLHMYPEIPENKVHVTGSPQFDRHLNPQFRFSREEFFEKIGLDPQRPLIVYTTATPGLIQHEINIIQHLADAVNKNQFIKNAQLLVRGHPRGFGSDIKLLNTIHPGVAVYPQPTSIPYRSLEHESRVVQLILEDEKMHLSTLAYQDVQVNVSGTMIVDSAVMDKPIVGIYYDLPSTIPSGLSVKRFYNRSDMRWLVKSGAFRLANSPGECIQLINRYLENPVLESGARLKIREAECGPLDGAAGERISKIMRNVSKIKV